MRKFLLIFHNWHVSSHGFKKKIIEVDTENEAYTIAKAECHERNDEFSSCAYTVVEITEDTMASIKLRLIPKWIRKLFNAL